MHPYAWYHWLTFFYLYCFFGWIFESTYVSLKSRRPVNRGFLRLPMLPLYGTGAVMMLWVSLPFQNHFILVYLSGVVAATLLEYVTGYVMELLFKVRYWDYSGKRFNLHGYICLTSSIAWGFLTILMTEVIHKPLEHFVLGLPPVIEGTLIAAVSGLFIRDTIQSTREALSLARALEAITRLHRELDELQVQMALLKAEARDTVVGVVREKADVLREALDARMASITDRLSDKRSALGDHLSMRRPSILRRNPGAVSRHCAGALKELRESWAARK